MVTKYYISWEIFGQMTETLMDDINNSGKEFDGVFGIPRGGLAIALVATQRLGGKRGLPMLLNVTSDSLIVDDISDEGGTLLRYTSKYEHRDKGPKSACLFSSDWTTAVPDWYIDKKTDKGQWIVYPWEASLEQAINENMRFDEIGQLDISNL